MALESVIRTARREAGLTQAELALRAETSQPAVARYEQGSAVPTLRTLERLLAACGRRVVISAVAADAAGSASDGPAPDLRLLRLHRKSSRPRRGARAGKTAVSRAEHERLRDIAAAVATIKSHVQRARTEPSLTNDPLLHDALLYELIVIGEAVKHVSADTRAREARVPWQDVAGLRDLIAHECFHIEMSRVLEIVERDLPALEHALDRLLTDADSGEQEVDDGSQDDGQS
jgi:uncharacterized protein with HEPN domain/DNA-binding XRE family transcriptional regulator